MGGEQAASVLATVTPRRPRGRRRGVVGRGRGGVQGADPRPVRAPGLALLLHRPALGRRHHRPRRHPPRARHGPRPPPPTRPDPGALLRRLPDVSAGARASIARAPAHRQPRRDRAAGDPQLPRGWASAPSRSTPTPTRAAPHVRAADDAVAGARATSTSTRVVAAARATGADAVHPGYGFLSERAAFARAVEDAGHRLRRARPPTVMDADGPQGRRPRDRGRRRRPGRPAARGERRRDRLPGAGQGRRRRRRQGHAGRARRRRAATRPSPPRGARRSAAFGDDTLLVEKYVERGRHIEVQVLADSHGNVVHLFERDCSTQRRHQKVIEEAPAPTITAEQRADWSPTAAVALARAGRLRQRRHRRVPARRRHRRGLLPGDEHPAPGRAPGHRAGRPGVRPRRAAAARRRRRAAAVRPGRRRGSTGHAIEARVYAEDAFGGFLPAGRHRRRSCAGRRRRPGRRTRWRAGRSVSTSYDPMLGKVIVHGADREAARRALVAALDDTAILGLTTNIGFLRALAAADEFRDAAHRHRLAGPARRRRRPTGDLRPARRGLDVGACRARGRRPAPVRRRRLAARGADPAPITVELDRARSSSTGSTRVVVDGARRTASGLGRPSTTSSSRVDGVAARGRASACRPHAVEVVHRGPALRLRAPRRRSPTTRSHAGDGTIAGADARHRARRSRSPRATGSRQGRCSA